ncbi:uncharacterized protein MONOS_11401 [Monocercomonoides exilis]|uniref:uncharacterized protein n=1 Tax=Monocercomonoides exilis TaxID=2049356 RepID=UPI00355AB0BF|nr:hypothetical protein MONOS_11401 [Monocercomonoides exilis]|eukprot:MONOS_11401.1-p1 / transcript=MONOS_11401.1 / gene=MONOS_11401 / organism=Monocercomonoides_exilis_PA203 / gene_product=unspecified product / transcript_product=unspecified product / location=Mono_scaffold00569:36595-37477(+) / protein_length=166 / sequence_SO=supercontig / SO=protein_coding / is_pseudo=false
MEHRYKECGSALRYDTVEGTFAVEKPRGGAGEHAITSPGEGNNERTARRRKALHLQALSYESDAVTNGSLWQLQSESIYWACLEYSYRSMDKRDCSPKGCRSSVLEDVDVGEKDAGIGKSTKIGLEEAHISSSSTKEYVVEVKMLIGRRKEPGDKSEGFFEKAEI